MGAYNTVRAYLRCARCNAPAEMDINIYAGLRNLIEYKIGDEYKWVPRKAVAKGGRPKGGNIDGEGYAECPKCNKDFFVRILIREDIIVGVEPDYDKRPNIPS